ncbi:porin family protein [Salinimicrobium sp. TH3]|uniref:porin family protein n=1 Tax=Salinimicrobium sp. TH3 TaxID=2997342 RepID=UPI002272C22E|nr:porin family protein [Salinimicrobium sp. TH3]MCY2687623.1 porin family protein [Salinimicrobium sp. TH3]
MKKISILSLALIFSISIHSYAQNSALEFGIIAGGNYSKFTPNFEVNGREYGDYQRKSGFYLGGFLNKRISEKFYFHPELHFALRRTDFLIKGVEITGHEVGSIVLDFETNITESVIAVPLIMRYYFTGSYYVDAGPQAGFIIDRDEKLENDPIEQPGNQEVITDYDYDNFDLGLNLGTGYNLTEDLIINGRYFFGIVERDNSIKSSVFSLGLEYKL